MKERTLKVLEFDKILLKLASKMETSIGSDHLSKEAVSIDINIIETKQRETTEGVKKIISKGHPPFGGIYKIRDYVKRAELSGVLSPGMLLKIGDNLRGSRLMRNYILLESDQNEPDSYSILTALGKRLNRNTTLEDSIFNAIISDEEISDNASSKLKSIRREISNKNQMIKTKLNAMVSSPSYQKYLQDTIITMRNDRYVLPVKVEYKNQVKGMIHDQSSTGATLFIEPMQIVTLNNELSILAIEEKKEIERILAELSAMVADFGAQLRENETVMAELDFIFAKAKLSLELRCQEPILNANMVINIKKGRHPLIPANDVVPIDIWLGKGFKTLVITGPNTGGKTVSLKTLGLFVLMTQFGLHIPANSGSEIGVFNNIFADIGDEQSIEQSLSTFSSHMKNIVEIFNEIEDNSLVLLDEVGAGTDPVEGAALATAILDRLNQYNIVTAATTHYSELKIYALTKPGVINGSVEFDVETLSPTYRVLIGVPGKSNAFEISKKLGLKPEVIEQARGLVESNNIEFEDALLKIDRDRKEIEEAKEEILRLQGEQAALKEKIRREERKIAEQKDKILKDAKYEARKLMEATKNESTAIISRLEKYSSDLDKASRKDINDIRDTINQSIKNMSESGYILETHDENQDIRLWDHVFISSLNQKGQVVSEPANDGKVTVQAGALKLNVPINTLKKIKAEVTEEKPKSYRKGFDITNKNIKTSIDLRGMSLEEAFLEIDKYLDDAYLSGLNEVQLIHGKGTGVLRQGIAEFLRKHQLVKDYRLGEFGEGGSGITVVKFK